MVKRPILVVGGTGSLGERLAPLLLEDSSVSRVRILSRGEHRQVELAEKLNSDRVDWFIGDCRDQERMVTASEGCQAVFHLASIKSVDKAEYDPSEAVKTIVDGTLNVIHACRVNKVDQALFTSTDKACEPLNIYGACKLVAEKLFIAGNVGSHSTRFSCVRYGNVLSSQGSVLAKWKRCLETRHNLEIMDQEMTRFFLLPKEAATFVYARFKDMKGGEVFIPKMKSTTLDELRRAFAPEAPFLRKPLRPGEKVHECLVSENEWAMTSDMGDYFIRWPLPPLFPLTLRGTFDPEPKKFTSENAERFTQDELKEMMCT